MVQPRSQAAATTRVSGLLPRARNGAPARSAPAYASYGRLRTPVATGDELADLRRQQARAHEIERRIGWRNAWLPALGVAPVAAVMALESPLLAGALGGGLISKQAPHQFKQIGRIKPGGDAAEAIDGRARHEILKRTVRDKPRWDYEPRYEGTRVRVDVAGPPRGPEGKRFQMELKPDTPSGRPAAARAVKKYEAQTKNKTRAIYCDPKKKPPK